MTFWILAALLLGAMLLAGARPAPTPPTPLFLVQLPEPQADTGSAGALLLFIAVVIAAVIFL